MADWIWLPEEHYPQQKWQRCRFSRRDLHGRGAVRPDLCRIRLFGCQRTGTGTADWYERPELWNEGDRELLITAGACAHRALRYHSIGAIRLTVQNEDTVPIPFGPICCRMEQGKSPELTIPPQIKVL